MLRFLLAGALLASIPMVAFSQDWTGYGGNSQHTAVYGGASQSIKNIHWQMPMDDDRAYYGNEILAHYASPMVTRGNTVVYGYRTTTTVNGAPYYDNWSLCGVSATTGAPIFSFQTDYSAAVIFPNGWTSVFPMTLVAPQPLIPVSPEVARTSLRSESTQSQRDIIIPRPIGGIKTGAAVAGAGGTIYYLASVDTPKIAPVQYCFYTDIHTYQANKSILSVVKINTPLTADNAGNVYFGYEIESTSARFAGMGTGGIAKVNTTTGASQFMTAENMKIDSSITRLAMNAAPTISNDGTSVYIALTGSNGGYLGKLSTLNLTTQSSVKLIDPSISGSDAFLIDQSSAAPMVGPDGQVFMGVFRNQYGESHGFMLQFDGNLNQTRANGNRYPVGAFGWDDTPSVVPAGIVPSYKGTARYLILTKYNNYDMPSDPNADGSNKVAVIDPTSDSVSTDRQTGIPVMNEILTVLGPTLTNDDSNHPNAVNEWCINSAAVDVAKQSAIINSEDGHVYRWSFVTNTLTEKMDLAPATGEAYTSTVIGPDGAIYALNNSILFALGD
jgi:hypothetical protein